MLFILFIRLNNNVIYLIIVVPSKFQSTYVVHICILDKTDLEGSDSPIRSRVGHRQTLWL